MKSFSDLSGLPLAYMGDAVIELLARRRTLDSGITDPGKLNELSRAYVTAKVQSDAVERLLPVLSEEETDIFHRGRNAHGISAPKSASVGQYRRATGMEALFGYLYLSDRQKRAEELFDIAYPKEEK